jgi:peptidoglycan/LPS O-acetylase OafA/YrhL
MKNKNIAPLKNITYYKGIDGLRAYSVMLVLFTHLGGYRFMVEHNIDLLWPILSGSAGVNFFFVISGFLISDILLKQKIKNKLSFKNFIFRRALRIFPLYYLFLIIIIVLTMLHVFKIDKVSIFAAALYLTKFLPRAYISGHLSHTWSLAVEEHFYLLWPLLLFKMQLKNIGKVILFGILVCIVVLFILLFNYGNEYAYRYTIPAAAPILFGSYLAYLRNTYLRFSSIFSKRNTILSIIVIACVLIFIPQQYSVFYWLLNAVVFFFIIGYMITYQASSLVSLFENSVLSYIGKISYGIYIWQGLFIGTGPGGKILIAGINFGAFPLNIVMTLLFSMLSYHLFELKFLRLKDKFFSA